MNLKKRTIITCFVKDPRYSLPKTRLAKWCGQDEATLVYLDCIHAIHLLFLDLSKMGFDCYWALDKGNQGLASSTESGTSALCILSEIEFKNSACLNNSQSKLESALLQFERNMSSHFVIDQGHGSLGQRLHSVYDSLMKNGERVLMIGADCPQLRIEDVEEAMRLMNEKSFVFGDATDGGFYLFGGKMPLSEATWTSVAYSVGSTLEDLEKKIQKNTSCNSGHLSKKYTDLDEEEDVLTFINEIKGEFRCKNIHDRLKNLV